MVFIKNYCLFSILLVLYSVKASKHNINEKEVIYHDSTNSLKIQQQRLSTSLTFKTDTCSKTYSCENCTAVRLCTPNQNGTGLVEYQVFNCSSNSPYCDPDSGTCVSYPSQGCDPTPKVGEYLCVKNGKFPTPNDCTKYYECVDYVSYTYSCPASYYYYNTISETCVQWGSCSNFYCYNSNGYKVPYSYDYRYFTYCVSSTSVFIDRCEGKDMLNITSQECEPVCVSEGLLPDTKNRSRYYRCNQESKLNRYKFILTRESCPNNYKFDDYLFRCVSVESYSISKLLYNEKESQLQIEGDKQLKSFSSSQFLNNLQNSKNMDVNEYTPIYSRRTTKKRTRKPTV